MRGLADAAKQSTRVYFTGGTTAVLMGWRTTTIDVDVRFVPDRDELLRAIPGLKESLRLNVELASPADFIPVRPDWEQRSPFIEQIGKLTFYHFDPYAQALAKVERGHAQDVADVQEMLRRGLVDPAQARAYFSAIEADLYRFPAIDAASFRRAVDTTFGALG
jgi:hypothetical protein